MSSSASLAPCLVGGQGVMGGVDLLLEALSSIFCQVSILSV